jgi:hypothetical protein
MMGSSTPLLSAWNKSYLTLGYQVSGFKSIAEIGASSRDQFHVLDISAQYFINDRISLAAVLPYKLNIRDANNSTSEVQGLGDIKIQGAYSFLQKQIDGKHPGIFLEGRMGLSLPTGKYDPLIHDNDLPENFNPGNGSLGFSVGQTLTITKKAGGLEFGNNFLYFLPSTSAYQFGSQFSSRLTFYGNIPVNKSLQILPFIGIEYQHVSKDLYANGNSVTETGGDNVLGTGGLQLKTGPFLTSCFINLPIIDHYANNTVQLQQQFRLSTTYIF